MVQLKNLRWFKAPCFVICSIVEHGEEKCKTEIKAHWECMKKMGFNVWYNLICYCYNMTTTHVNERLMYSDFWQCAIRIAKYKWLRQYVHFGNLAIFCVEPVDAVALKLSCFRSFSLLMPGPMCVILLVSVIRLRILSMIPLCGLRCWYQLFYLIALIFYCCL